jgi:hypothetical protein
LEKKNVFPKKYVELRTFDGTHIVKFAKDSTTSSKLISNGGGKEVRGEGGKGEK